MKTITNFKPYLLLCLLFIIAGQVHAIKWTVTASNFAFSPSSLTNVKVGDTIHWLWNNGSHTTTSATIPAGAASWDSPLNSSSTSFEYKVTVAGTYNYVCTPHASLGMTGSFIATPASLSVPSRESEQFSIFPDPSAGLFFISARSMTDRILGVTVFNMTGKNVYEEKSDLENPIMVDLRDQYAGCYFVRIQTDQKVFVRKLNIYR